MRAAARLVLCVNTDFIDLYRQTESCPSRTALFSSGGEPHARFIRPDVHPVRPGPSRRKAQRGAVSGLCARGTHGIPVSRRIFRSRCRRRGGGALLSRHSQRSAAPLQIRRQTAVCCMVRRRDGGGSRRAARPVAAHLHHIPAARLSPRTGARLQSGRAARASDRAITLDALRFRAAQASVYRPSVRAAGRCRPCPPAG